VSHQYEYVDESQFPENDSDSSHEHKVGQFQGTFLKEKETKNTWRYRAKKEGKPPVTEYIYLAKWFLTEDPPKEIRVSIEFD
jgi:hypothetical protein